MKPLKLSLALSLPLALAAVAVPASAAPNFDRHDNRTEWNQRGDAGQVQALTAQLHQIDRQIDRGLATHRLDRREASQLQRQVGQLNREIGLAQRGGLDRFEMRNLQQKITGLRFRLDRQLNDFNGRGFDNRDGDHRGH
ncbi:MAG: hypothetical protein ACKOPE_10565 [Novosphingobium sp.]